MEQISNYRAAQSFIDTLTSTTQDERHAAQQSTAPQDQRDSELGIPGENRAQRRERERKERRCAKKVKA